MKKQAVVINEKDNVATVVDNLPAESVVSFFIGQTEQQLKLLENIPSGHKFAIKKIPRNGDVLKYGESIGSATREINPGEHVHIHNMQSNRGRGDLN